MRRTRISQRPSTKGGKWPLVVDGVAVKDYALTLAMEAKTKEGRLQTISWADFLSRAKVAHQELLDIRDTALADPDSEL